jgi:hypothetical protein
MVIFYDYYEITQKNRTRTSAIDEYFFPSHMLSCVDLQGF